jgi:hypothetical protein
MSKFRAGCFRDRRWIRPFSVKMSLGQNFQWTKSGWTDSVLVKMSHGYSLGDLSVKAPFHNCIPTTTIQIIYLFCCSVQRFRTISFVLHAYMQPYNWQPADIHTYFIRAWQYMYIYISVASVASGRRERPGGGGAIPLSCPPIHTRTYNTTPFPPLPVPCSCSYPPRSNACSLGLSQGAAC